MEEENDSSSDSSTSADDEEDEEAMLAAREVELRSCVEEGDVGSLLEALRQLTVTGCSQEDSRRLTQTVLEAAAAQGNTQCVAAVIQATNCSVNEADIHGDDSLILAAKGGHVTTIQHLLSAGSNIFQRNTAGCTALDVACERHHVAAISALLEHALDCHRRNVYGGAGFRKYLYTALITATECEHVQVVNRFIEAGVDINMNLNVDTGTALHCAVETENTEIVTLLLAHKASTEALRKCHLQTPLMLACQLGHVTAARRLLGAGADINRQTEECSSALTLACHFGHSEVVKLLIDEGADVNQKNRWGFNPLFMGADTPDIMRQLLEAGADPDTPCGERDERPLHLASVVGSGEAIQLLLGAGADINIRTNENENSLWLAVWKGHADIAKMLIQRNIELDVASNACQVYHWDYLPVEVALGQGHFEVAMMLLLAGCSRRNHLYFSTTDPGPLEELPTLKLRPEPLSVLQGSPQQLDRVRELVCNPPSLKHACRLFLRRYWGTSVVAKVKLLEIPLDLLGYLLLEDL